MQSEESAGPYLPELVQKTADLKRLQGAITDTYAAAESAYGQGETLEALRMFETVNGYADAERWKELCCVRIHREITRYFEQDKLLTAWVQQMLFLQLTRPQKAETIPPSFGALRGIWICRDDQQIHVQQLATESGDGRAGTAPEGVPPIRCLMAEGDGLYGCRADEMLAPVSEENFTETICTGGILRAEKAAENQDPAAAVLVVKAQDGRSEDGIDRLEVISENIIMIKEGEWKGTYYRVLEN